MRLVVTHPATIEKAALLDESEWITLPIGTLGFHHIKVRQQQNGLGPTILGMVFARQRRHQPAILRAFRGAREQPDIRIAKPRRLQPRRHPLRRQIATAARHAGVGFHQLLVQRAKRLLIGAELRCGRNSDGGGKQDGDERAHDDLPLWRVSKRRAGTMARAKGKRVKEECGLRRAGARPLHPIRGLVLPKAKRVQPLLTPPVRRTARTILNHRPAGLSAGRSSPCVRAG